MSDPRILPHERTPSNWGEAFAAMPSEAPDADAWPCIARAAWSQPRRPAWPAWLAAAAVLAVVVVLPWRLAKESETQSAAPVAARTVPEPAATARAANADAAQADAQVAASSPAGSGAASGAESPASSASSSSNDGMPNAQQRIATAEPAGRDTGVVAQGTTSATTQADVAPADATNAPLRLATDADADAVTPADSSASGSELEQLYTESAQLEALVAMARDDRVATTGTAAALASQYDAQVADIDGRLIQPDVTPEERTRLWRARVAALRELAGFESTQRLLAAHGERYDAMLVSID
jgi:hypothetical protein